MTGLFITAIGTDIGKTFVSCAILHQMSQLGIAAHAIKPIASGIAGNLSASDPARLLKAKGASQELAAIQRICPWSYEAPLSPHLAARLSAEPIDWQALVAFCEQEISSHSFTLVEGAGGVMSPLDDTHTNLDLIIALRLPTVLVASNYLGAISHTLTALEVLLHADVPLAGLVISAHESPAIDEAEMRQLLDLRIKKSYPIWWIERFSDDINSYTSAPSLELLWNKHLKS